jgi:hypothetical protein
VCGVWKRAVGLGVVFSIALMSLACLDEAGDIIKNIPRMSGDLVTRTAPEVDATATSDTPRPRPDDVPTLLDTLGNLDVAPRGSGVEYNRRDWRHWVDADRDCQNTRAEVLISESLAPVSFAPEDDGDKCRVISGQWVGPWTGEVFTDASDVDIDHHVPLAHAHESGGWRWNPQRKRAYANDLTYPASLQATSAPVNRSKGKQPPDEWRPQESAGWCRYAADWISVKEAWDLTVTPPEVDALEKMLATCGDDASWGLSVPPGG